jgi:hypothetical protein
MTALQVLAFDDTPILGGGLPLADPLWPDESFASTGQSNWQAFTVGHPVKFDDYYQLYVASYVTSGLAGIVVTGLGQTVIDSFSTCSDLYFPAYLGTGVVTARPDSLGFYDGSACALVIDDAQLCLTDDVESYHPRPNIEEDDHVQSFGQGIAFRFGDVEARLVSGDTNWQAKSDYKLRSAINKSFPGAEVQNSEYSDPDGGTTPTLVVRTNIEDIEKKLLGEDVFYALVSADDSLAEALREIGVIFE